MSIAMQSNLKRPDAVRVILCFNYDAHTKVQVGQSIHCCPVAFSTDTLRYAVTLTFDPVTLTRDTLTLNICSVWD